MKKYKLTLSKAVLHALGCVATKIGFVDMMIGFCHVLSKTFKVQDQSISQEGFSMVVQCCWAVFQGNKLGNQI